MADFLCYFLGAEQAGWRRMLLDAEVRNVGLSYWAARKRLPKKKAYSMDWGFERVFLDSGGFTANKDPAQCTQREWRTYGTEYADFVLDHLDELDMVSEFDCLALGPAWIEEMRQAVWDKIPPEKFLPIWHPEHGLTALSEMGEKYDRIGIAQDHISLPGMNITPHLNKLANGGVHLHGLAMSRPDAIRHVHFSSVSSTSWLSAMRYGETIFWDGSKLVRYPAKMKDQARTRHMGHFERAGFDVERIKADDGNEMTRIAIWSWLQYEASVRGERVTTRGRKDAAENPENDGASVDTSVETVRNPAPTLRVREQAEMQALPVLGFKEIDGVAPDSNETVKYSLPIVSNVSLRACNTCVVREDCPGFEANATCKFNVPIEMRTPAQRQAFMDACIEIQGQRVAFMRFREELTGGYADPNLSQELDRLFKMFATQAEILDDRDFFKIQMEGRGKAGVLSRLFGKEAADAADDGPKLDRQDTDRLMQKVIQGSVAE